jgi:hypothetical protein
LIKRESFAKRVESRIPETVPVQMHAVHKKKRVSWRWVELVPAAAVFTLLLLNPLVVRKFNQNLASLIPEVHLQAPYNQPVNEEQFISPVATAVDSGFMASTYADTAVTNTSAPENEQPLTTLHTEEEKPAEVKADVITTNHSNEPSVPSSGDTHFYVVAGCFRIEENAKEFHDDLVSKGYASEMIGKYKGLHVVTFEKTSSFSDGKLEVDKLKSQSLDAWVLKK